MLHRGDDRRCRRGRKFRRLGAGGGGGAAAVGDEVYVVGAEEVGIADRIGGRMEMVAHGLGVCFGDDVRAVDGA